MKNLLLMITIWLAAFQVGAQAVDKAKLEKTIDSLLTEFKNPGSPGIAMTVLQNGQPVVKRNYGMANLEHKVPYTHASPVRLVYSMGREFMSVGLALMEAEGLLRFDDKVRKFLPKLPEWSKDVTIQDLINHSSGFDDEWSLLLMMTADMRSHVESEQVLTLLFNQPKPQIEPGKGYMYNNTDFALLRIVMEIAAKQQLPEYLNKKLFAPLGMSSTFMNDDVEMVIPGFADSYYGYGSFRKGRFIKSSPGGNYRMVTTADDLEKWALAIDDPNSIVAKAFARLYKDARPFPVVSPARHYAFGHEIKTENKTEVIYHGGVDDSFYMVRIPSKRTTVIALGNSMDFIYPLMQTVNSMLPPSSSPSTDVRFFPKQKVKLKKEEISKYAGRYFEQRVSYNSHIKTIRYFDLKHNGDSLNLYPPSSNEGYPITSFGDGYFKLLDENSMMRFTKPHPDSAMRWEIWQDNGMEPLILLREEKQINATKENLQQFTGQFYSAHLDYYFRVVLSDDGTKLNFVRPTIPQTALQPSVKDQFLFAIWNGASTAIARAKFMRDKAGKVDGFSIQYYG